MYGNLSCTRSNGSHAYVDSLSYSFRLGSGRVVGVASTPRLSGSKELNLDLISRLKRATVTLLPATDELPPATIKKSSLRHAQGESSPIRLGPLFVLTQPPTGDLLAFRAATVATARWLSTCSRRRQRKSHLRSVPALAPGS